MVALINAAKNIIPTFDKYPIPSHNIISGIQANAGTGLIRLNKGIAYLSNLRLQAIAIPKGTPIKTPTPYPPSAIFKLERICSIRFAPSGVVPPVSL